MSIRHLIQSAALAAALGISGTLPAMAESTNSTTFEGWANQTAPSYQGRIPRDIYLDEMGRRWDADPNHRGSRSAYLDRERARWEAVDSGNHGLTPAQVSELTGKVDTSAGPALSGSGVQAGNMGPGNAKGQ